MFRNYRYTGPSQHTKKQTLKQEQNIRQIIQGRRSWCKSKAHMQLPMSHNYLVTLYVSPTAFEILTHFTQK